MKKIKTVKSIEKNKRKVYNAYDLFSDLKKSGKIKTHKPKIFDLLEQWQDNIKDKFQVSETVIRKAVFYDERGEYHGKQSFNKNDKFIFYNDNSAYIVDLQNPSRRKFKGFIWSTYEYYYQLGNPEPLVLKQDYKPTLPPEVFWIMLKTETAKKINDLAKNNWAQYLNAKTIILGIAVVGVVVYLLMGGKITGG